MTKAKPRRGVQVALSPSEWEELLTRWYVVERCRGAPFLGWKLTPRDLPFS